ncbi:hypothetical protein DFH27DRAFT_542494 [Peziza echinospora]|nr:hypothetical protein DFH27DRAFT_542494 [Peziza echinospora]
MDYSAHTTTPPSNHYAHEDPTPSCIKSVLNLIQTNPYILPFLYLIAGLLAHKAFTDPNPRSSSDRAGATTHTVNKHETTSSKTTQSSGVGGTPPTSPASASGRSNVLNQGGVIGAGVTNVPGVVNQGAYTSNRNAEPSKTTIPVTSTTTTITANNEEKPIEEPLLIQISTNPFFLSVLRHLGITLPLLHAALRHLVSTIPTTISTSTSTTTSTTTTATALNHEHTHTGGHSTSSQHHQYPSTTAPTFLAHLLPKQLICPTHSYSPPTSPCTTFTTTLLPLTILILASLVRIQCFRQLKSSFSFNLRIPKTPLVTTGLYKYVRHPSYLAATVASAVLLYFITGGLLPSKAETEGFYEFVGGRGVGKYDAYGRIPGEGYTGQKEHHYGGGLDDVHYHGGGSGGGGGGGLLRCYMGEKEAVLWGRILWAMWTGMMPLWCALRIKGEERMLREKVKGFREYAARTWRLLPGIW